jgi:hypothetical protein
MIAAGKQKIYKQSDPHTLNMRIKKIDADLH